VPEFLCPCLLLFLPLQTVEVHSDYTSSKSNCWEVHSGTVIHPVRARHFKTHALLSCAIDASESWLV
jgi:hypothetical protein